MKNMNASDNMEQFLTIKDVQNHLQLGRNRVYQLIKIDSFPKIKIGNTYRIPKQKYLEWVENNIGKIISGIKIIDSDRKDCFSLIKKVACNRYGRPFFVIH